MKVLGICLFLFVFCFKLQAQLSTEILSKNKGQLLLENKGQWPEGVLFRSNMPGGKLWVQQHKLIFHLQDYSKMHKLHAMAEPNYKGQDVSQTLVHLNFRGSNEVINIEKKDPSSSYFNFFKGNDQKKWTSEVHSYSEAILKNFYQGIDFKISGINNEVKYEFIVQKNSDPSQIILDYSGQKKIQIDNKGNLILETDLGKVIEEKPVAYQLINGQRKEVKCRFILKDNEVRFYLGNYDPNAPLIIDPILVFATYNGANSDNFGMTATYGNDGTAYTAGTIYGNDYPAPDVLAYDIQSNFVAGAIGYGISDVFVSKYSSDGSAMLWGTFIGGGDNTQGTETVHSLICDQNNNVYMMGATSSSDFPITSNSFQQVHSGGTAAQFTFNGITFSNQGTDIYVVKISSNGHNLLNSTFVGGSGNDGVNYNPLSLPYNSAAAYSALSSNYGDQFRGEIMLDENNNILIASTSRSTDFPIVNAFQSVNAGGQDGIVFKLASNFQSLLFSTYYGGSSDDACYSVKIDTANQIVFSGGTQSTDLPGTVGAYSPTYNGGITDGFVVKLNSTGLGIQKATYLGKNNYDQAFFVEIDKNNNIYVLGQSVGGTFPVVNATFSNPNSSNFIIELNSNLTSNIASTVFGNGSPSIHISPSAFLVDICGNIYVSGWGANILQGTPLNGMPVTLNAFQGTPPNGFDFYLIVIKRDFQGLLYGSYLGGSQAQEHVDGGTSRFDKNGVVYQSVCGGCGGYSDFPTTPGAWSASNNSSNCNNIVFKFSTDVIPIANFTASSTSSCEEIPITFQNNSTENDTYLWDFGNNNFDSTTFSPSYTYSIPGVYTVFLYVTDNDCDITDTAQITITIYENIQLNLIDAIDLCSPVPINLISYTNGTASNFIWSSNPLFTDTLNFDFSDSLFVLNDPQAGYYYVQVSNSECALIDSVLLSFTSSDLILNGGNNLCLGDQTTLSATNTNPTISFNYVWTPITGIIGSNTSSSIVVQPLFSQYYYLSAASSNGCFVEDSIFILVSVINPASVLASASEYIVVPGSTVVLSGLPNSLPNYSWSPTTGLSSPNSQETNALIQENTIFTLTVSDGICTRSDTVQIKVYEIICEEPYVFIPNAFSPNGDDNNDVLFVRGIFIEKMIFRIFDRWGELVFESENPQIGWDGTFRGKKLDPDVYDFYLDVTCYNGLKSITKGNVTLMK
jgi:gliding motility-associated-like protein